MWLLVLVCVLDSDTLPPKLESPQLSLCDSVCVALVEPELVVPSLTVAVPSVATQAPALNVKFSEALAELFVPPLALMLVLRLPTDDDPLPE